MIINSPKDLGLFIAAERKKQKLSQKKVGDLVGLKQKTISAIENNPETVKLDTLFRVLSALSLEISITSKDDSSNKWSEEW